MGTTSIASAARPETVLPVRLSLFGDERLARLVASGNDRAFATIYDRYHRQLYRYCRAIVRHDADAQDALQSALTNAFLALKRAQRDAPLRPWLFRIVHNEAISLIRRRGAEEELEAAREQCGGSAEDRARERERLALLIADLQELPVRQRAALVMRELNGLSHEEIGVALETSVGSAKQAIFEARRGLMEFEEGRSMVCEEVRRTVSDGDGRARRGRRVRAHLRDCAACSAFATAIPARQQEMRMLLPAVAPAASAAILAHVLGAQSGHGAGAGAGSGIAATGAAGKAVGASLAAKALAGATVLVTAAAGVVGVHAVMPSNHHSTGQSISAYRPGTGATADVPTRAAGPARRSPASTPGVQSTTRAGQGVAGAPVAPDASSGTASPGRAFNPGRHLQRAGGFGVGGASNPGTGRHAGGSPASLSATSNSPPGPRVHGSPASAAARQATPRPRGLRVGKRSGS